MVILHWKQAASCDKPIYCFPYHAGVCWIQYLT